MPSNYLISLSPTVLTFAVIALGLCIGKLKIRHVSLDMAAVLIVAVVLGYVLHLCGIENHPSQMV